MKTLKIDTPFGTANAHLSSAGEPRVALALGHALVAGCGRKTLLRWRASHTWWE